MIVDGMEQWFVNVAFVSDYRRVFLGTHTYSCWGAAHEGELEH